MQLAHKNCHKAFYAFRFCLILGLLIMTRMHLRLVENVTIQTSRRQEGKDTIPTIPLLEEKGTIQIILRQEEKGMTRIILRQENEEIIMNLRLDGKVDGVITMTKMSKSNKNQIVTFLLRE